MSLFSRDMNEQKTAGGSRGLDLNDGTYVLECIEVKDVQTRNKGPAQEFLFRVKEASGEGATAVGSNVNEYCIENNDIGAMYQKTVLVCLMGLDGTNADDKKLIAEENWNKCRDNAASWCPGRLINVTVAQAKYKNPRTDGKTTYSRRSYTPNPTVRAATMKKLGLAK